MAKRYGVTPGAVRKWLRNQATVPYNVVHDLMMLVAESLRTCHQRTTRRPEIHVEEFVRPTVFYKPGHKTRKEQRTNG